MADAAQARIWLKRPSPVLGNGLAVLLSVLAQAARLPLHPPTQIPYITYVPFLFLSAAIGGLGPGLLATLLCSLESLYFATDPVGSFAARDPQSWLGLAGLALTGTLISLIFERLKTSGERLSAAWLELEAAHRESRRAQKSLAQEHARTRDILESLGDGFIALDREWRYVYVNTAAARILHKAPQEMLGQTQWELWPHTADSVFGLTFRRSVEQNVPLWVEGFYPEPLNAWFEVRCYPSPEGMSFLFSDITEHKRAAEETRETQERLALIVSATRMGTFDWFPQTGRILWSDLTRCHLGVPADAPASVETLRRALHPDDRDRILQRIEDVLRPGSDGEYAEEYRTVGIEDAVERWVSARGRVFFEAGLPARFIGITLEITDQKHLEQQFLQAQKLESIGRLAGGVAHDFNNLLTVIMGYSHMLLRDLLTEETRDAVEEIAQASARAEELTRQLLAFSRRQVIEPRNVVLNDLLESFERMLRRLLGEEIEIVLSLSPEPGAIRADPGQIEQIIMNLAVNARDAMPGGGRLVLETANVSIGEEFRRTHLDVPHGPYVVLSVSDTGTGMPPEVQAHIFEPFYTTKEKGKGTGLGLSTVYGIVKQSGGAIWLYSEPGRGTTFKLYFPAVDAPGAAIEEPSAETALLTGNQTILLAEDEPKVRLYTQRILERHGYQVLAGANGVEALDLARQHPGPIHLLLTDAVMPVMGGGELAGKFVTVRPGVPVLCMSGYTELLWPQAENFIHKPFTPQALLSRVHDLLNA